MPEALKAGIVAMVKAAKKRSEKRRRQGRKKAMFKGEAKEQGGDKEIKIGSEIVENPEIVPIAAEPTRRDCAGAAPTKALEQSIEGVAAGERNERGQFVKGRYRGGPGGARFGPRRLLRRRTVLDAFRNLSEAAMMGKPWAIGWILKIVLEERRRQSGKEAEPIGPRVKVNVDLSRMLDGRMAEVMREPPVPGLPPPRLAPPAPREEPPDGGTSAAGEDPPKT